MKYIIILLFFPFLLGSCRENIEAIKIKYAQAQIPVYVRQLNKDTIRYDSVHSIRFPDKIIDTLNARFILDKFFGIQIYDISDTNNIRSIGFYAINGCSKLNIKDGLLCTNYFRDSMTINYELIHAPKIINYSTDIHKNIYRGLPSQPGPFECVEADSGYVVGWIWKFKPDVLCTTL